MRIENIKKKIPHHINMKTLPNVFRDYRWNKLENGWGWGSRYRERESEKSVCACVKETWTTLDKSREKRVCLMQTYHTCIFDNGSKVRR